MLGDADKAQYNAAHIVFPDATLLMCYFHVVKNCREKLIHLPRAQYCSIMQSITKLHYLLPEVDYNLVSAEWPPEFKRYFERQWVNTDFCNWKVSCTPVGCSTTNNPCEQYNSTIKKYTGRNRVKVPVFISNFLKTNH